MNNRERRFKKLGLVGSSQIEKYPLELLEDQSLEPIMLSSSPKNARDLINSGKLEQIIDEIIEHHHDMDAVFIFIGGNDVRKHCKVTEIASNIKDIAEKFNSIGVEAIIMPLINRNKPSGIEVPQYTKIRNSINRWLRKFYRNNRKRYTVLNIDNLDLRRDGVHLTRYSYRRISRAIKNQMDALTNSNLRTPGVHRFDESEYMVEYYYQ